MKNIVIIGAGISGLTAAWFLKKKHPQSKITILEKSSRAGGLIQTRIENGFLFETGPHTLRASDQSEETLNLIRELRLEKQLIFASPDSRRRYLFIGGKLREIPSHLIGLIRQPWMWPMILAAIQELFRPPEHHEEETVQSFFTRRFGKRFTETLIDPLCLGIYAGDISRLSLPSCFPLMDIWEHTLGSITKGIFQKRKKTDDLLLRKCQEAGSFSFLHGMEEFPKALVAQLDAKIQYHISDLSIDYRQKQIQVTYRTSEVCSILADYLLFAIPAPELLSILPIKHACERGESITSVNVGFRHLTFKHRGFGYLVPSKEQSPILGMIWDSSLFPEQNAQSQSLRLTVMIKSKQTEDCLKTAFKALHEHLGINHEPDAVLVRKQTIPQYYYGHRQSVEKLKKEIKNLHPQISFIGNHFFGVGVNDCIVHAKSFVDSMI